MGASLYMLTKALLQVWNETVATLTLMALGLLGRNGSSFSSIEHFYFVRNEEDCLTSKSTSISLLKQTLVKYPFPRIKQLPA